MPTESEHRRLTVGGKCSTGQIIDTILGQSARATVFTTTDNHLRWQYHENDGELSDQQVYFVNEFDSLMTEIRVHVPKHNRQEAFNRLGKALFSALNTKEEGELADHFESTKAFVAQASSQRARFLYTAFALGISVVTIIAFLLAGYYWLAQEIAYVYGAIFGAAGAAVSVMQRSRDLDIDSRLPDRSIYLQASMRVLLGIVFGVVFIFASKANLIMGTISADVNALCVFALVAGFSERFIPDLIERLETRAKGDA